MNIALISSSQDAASINIKHRLLDNFGFMPTGKKFDGNDVFQCLTGNNEGSNNKTNANEKNSNKDNPDKKIIRLYTINSMHVLTDNLDKKIGADAFVVVSRHKAEGGRASLTTHPIGNFGKAAAGGKDRLLCISPAFLLKSIFLELARNAENSGYEATLEATHHGPYMEKPVLYAELGSNEKFWEDKAGAKIVAKSLMAALDSFNKRYLTMDKNSSNSEKSNNAPSGMNKKNSNIASKKNAETENDGFGSILVIGGTHYNHAASKAMLNTGYAAGHICPKHNFEDLDEEMLKQAMEKTGPRPKFALLDWKGLGKEKQRIVEMLENGSMKYKRSDKFFSQQ